jgi:hypothetical protein
MYVISLELETYPTVEELRKRIRFRAWESAHPPEQAEHKFMKKKG